MDRPPRNLAQHRLASKRPNPVPRVLLILLLFALPMVLIPLALDAVSLPESAPRPNPREEVNRALAQDGVVLGEGRPTTGGEEPVEVAGAFVTASASEVPAPAVELPDEDAVVILDEEEDLDPGDGEWARVWGEDEDMEDDE